LLSILAVSNQENNFTGNVVLKGNNKKGFKNSYIFPNNLQNNFSSCILLQ